MNIALTFDDGPNIEYTPKLLKELEKRDILATFFSLGSQIEKNPEIIIKAHKNGHEIANHTWDHPILTNLKDNEIEYQLEKTNCIIKKFLGIQPSLFRPPNGAIDKRIASIASNLKLSSILWSVSSQDWAIKDIQKIARNIIINSENGSIILMHDTSLESIEAAILAIEILLDRGFNFVTVSKIFEIFSNSINDGKIYKKAVVNNNG